MIYKKENVRSVRRTVYTVATLVGVMGLWNSAAAVPILHNSKAGFLAAAGTTTTYGFETHNLVEGDFGTPPTSTSPIAAADLDNSFDLAYTNLNGFSVVDNAGAAGVVDGTHYLFTHSQLSLPAIVDYTMTFSNFSGSAQSITAFGFTITDFASNITTPVTIDYTTGLLSGTLLTVPAGQPDFTQNFVGVTVGPGEEFSSITITFDDNFSGFQDFDEFIFSSQPIPEPTTLALMGLGLAGIGYRRHRGRIAA